MDGLNATIRDIRAYILDLRPRRFAVDQKYGSSLTVRALRAAEPSEYDRADLEERLETLTVESRRREEVLQYLYEKYGRERAGLAAVVVSYRTKSAIRDVGKALGLSLDRVDALAKHVEGYSHDPLFAQRCREVGIDPESEIGRRLVHLVGEILGFPRHLSQHVGGMVMTRGPLCELVPIENAAMEDRTMVEWLEYHGIPFAIVLTKTDTEAKPAHRGISAFLLEPGTPGFTSGKQFDKLGYKGVETTELAFDDARVTAANLLGGNEGSGFQHVMSALEVGRINVAARGVGVAQAAFDDAIEAELAKKR